MKFKKTSKLDLVMYSRSDSHRTCYICMDINAVAISVTLQLHL